MPELETIKANIKYDKDQPTEEILRKYSQSFPLRKKDIGKLNITDFLKEWPILISGNSKSCVGLKLFLFSNKIIIRAYNLFTD